MGIFSLSIKQPVLITMIMAAALVMGGISYSRMAVDLFPNVSFPVLAITTSYPGASPEEIEALLQVTRNPRNRTPSRSRDS